MHFRFIGYFNTNVYYYYESIEIYQFIQWQMYFVTNICNIVENNSIPYNKRYVHCKFPFGIKNNSLQFSSPSNIKELKIINKFNYIYHRQS